MSTYMHGDNVAVLLFCELQYFLGGIVNRKNSRFKAVEKLSTYKVSSKKGKKEKGSMPENTNGDDNATTSSLLRAEDGTMDEECHREEKRPKEPWGGEYVKSIVYAGLDAIITSFSLISSISGGSLSSGTYTHIIASELFFFSSKCCFLYLDSHIVDSVLQWMFWYWGLQIW